MKILHYFLGFPPYRTGGLTKYCCDLMDAQIKNGDIVFALWPGKMSFIFKKVKIKKRGDRNSIKNFEIINPLPVPLDEGIRNFEDYMKKGEETVYEKFLKKIHPDIIHVHTLMGIHYEFFYIAKKLNIKTIFTTHDYFGLCPKVTFYRFGKVCEDDDCCKNCVQCNMTALSIKKIMIMQSPIYRVLKNCKIVKILRQKHRQQFFSIDDYPILNLSQNEINTIAENYKELRSYYLKIFSCIDLIHFNSSIAEKIYNRYFKPNKSQILSISHKNILDRRKVIEWQYKGKLRITCLAPTKPFKGFDVLRDALDSLWKSGKRNFELKVFNFVQERKPYMIVDDKGFKQEDLCDIFAETDVVVAVSTWYETFGFTVLEALSYGVPVIVSDHVGAKDIVGGGGIIVKAGDQEDLKKAINSLTEKKLKKLREEIQTSLNIKTWEKFLCDNYELYQYK